MDTVNGEFAGSSPGSATLQAGSCSQGIDTPAPQMARSKSVRPVCHRLALVSWSTQSGKFGAQMHAVRARARLGHHWSQSCGSGAMLVVSSGGRTPWLGCQVVGWHGRGSSGLGPAKRVSSCRLRRPPALPPTSSPRSRTNVLPDFLARYTVDGVNNSICGTHNSVCPLNEGR